MPNRLFRLLCTVRPLFCRCPLNAFFSNIILQFIPHPICNFCDIQCVCHTTVRSTGHTLAFIKAVSIFVVPTKHPGLALPDRQPIKKEPEIFDKGRPTLKGRVEDVSRHGEFVFAMVAR